MKTDERSRLLSLGEVKNNVPNFESLIEHCSVRPKQSVCYHCKLNYTRLCAKADSMDKVKRIHGAHSSSGVTIDIHTSGEKNSSPDSVDEWKEESHFLKERNRSCLHFASTMQATICFFFSHGEICCWSHHAVMRPTGDLRRNKLGRVDRNKSGAKYMAVFVKKNNVLEAVKDWRLTFQ